MLHTVAIISIVVALLCVVVVAVDILAGNRQPMGVMNFVWVLTPLYSGVVGLWAYYKLGRPMAKARLWPAARTENPVRATANTWLWALKSLFGRAWP